MASADCLSKRQGTAVTVQPPDLLLGRLTPAPLHRQHKCLADFPQCNAPGLCAQCIFETPDRFAQWFEAEAEGLVVHGHDKLRAGGVCHFDRLLGRAMRPDPRVVSANWHDRQIDAALFTQVGKTVRYRRVSGENDATAISFQEIAVVAAVSIPLLSRAPMFHAESEDVDLAGGSIDPLTLAPAKFTHVAQSRPTKQIRRVRRRDHGGVFVKPIQRSQVEVIEVRV